MQRNSILRYSEPTHVHVFVNGQIVESGGKELADELEISGYGEWAPAEPSAAPLVPDPFDL